MRPVRLAFFACASILVACGGDDPVGSSKPLGSGASGTGTTTSAHGGAGGAATTASGGAGGAGATSAGGGSSGGHGGASTTTTTTTITGAGGASCAEGDAAIAQLGKPGSILLRGTVVTPDDVYDGEVLVVGDTIACADVSCAATPGAADASVVETHGIIFPGMIDTHNHILFDIFDEDDWAPTKVYSNHNQWGAEPRYGAMLDCKQWLNGEGKSPLDFGCEMDKYGELKGLVAGTTAIVGAPNPGNRACFASLSRSIDQTKNGLPTDKVQTSTPFPPSSGDAVCDNFTNGKTDAFLVHCGEGVDATAKNEFAKLGTTTTVDGCLYSPKTAIVHGAAFDATELDVMAAHQMSLVWSPKSNVFLYGGGTDMKKTARVPDALAKGINVALAPDWSLGGSQNLLDELRFADRVDTEAFGDVIDHKTLVQMVTKNAAKALGLESVLGTIEKGKKADLFVIGGDTTKPYDALLAATPLDVRLVLVAGAPLYGDPSLVGIAQAAPPCEPIDLCCRTKFVCFAAPGGDASNKLGQTFAEVTDILTKALTDYDAQKLTQWSFAPLAPVVKCP
jgi:hypothetical protein